MAGMPGEALLVLAALIIEACVGYPRALLEQLGHPVMWIGHVIDALERSWNRPHWSAPVRRALGVATLLIVLTLVSIVTLSLTWLARQVEWGVVLIVILGTAGLAQRSLFEHVQAVAHRLVENDLSGAREAVGRIVGRDTHRLDAHEVSGAAIESLAESFNDAVVAPAFWFLVGGLPGLFVYKAINTADSMIGHKEERWRAFGWAAARLDDVVNLVPARLAGLLLAVAAGRGFTIMWRDASRHASPNAGWPEAALAGALDVRLGGPATYDGVVHARPYFGDGAHPQITDLSRALTLYKRACALLWVLLALLWLLQAIP
jgi:adenosylcobinamide-phosphate synthase